MINEHEILYEAEGQKLERIYIEQHFNSKRRHFNLTIINDDKEKTISFFLKPRAKLPEMPILCSDTVQQDRELIELLTWFVDSKHQIWINFGGTDRLEKVDHDYLLWLFEDPYKNTKEKLNNIMKDKI